MRRFSYRLITCLVLAAAAFAGAVAWSAPQKKSKQIKLVVWGLPSGEETYGLDATLAEYERLHPNIKIIALSMGAGGMNPQKLMTSIVGHVPPDLVDQDRFTIGDWAARQAFMPLDSFIAHDSGPDAIREADYYPACWKEAVYKGHVYAIPYGTDDRALYWNRTLFREAGLDPNKPPRTWDELYHMAVKLTTYNPDGTFKTIGFIPNFGNSWLYLYSWQNGGNFMSPDGKTCTLDNPETAGALKFMVKCYDALKGAEFIGAFVSTFQPNELDPFYTGKVAMKIDGNWVLQGIARYAPNLDFGTAPAPVPTARLLGQGRFKGQPKFITWSGGFSFAIPKGARHPKQAWDFIKWMNSIRGNMVLNRVQAEYNKSQGRTYVPTMSANMRVNEAIFKAFAPKNAQLHKSLRMFLDLMPVSKFRPVTFVGQKLWDEQVRAFEQAINHKQSPEAALLAGQQAVQKQLDAERMKSSYPLVNWAYVYGIVGLLILLGIVAIFLGLRRRRMGRLARQEAWAAYAFVSPWIFGLCVFTLGPIIASLVFSFCSYDVLHPARWIGAANYTTLLGLHHVAVHWFSGLKDVHHWYDYLQPGRYFTVTADASAPLAWKSIYNVFYLSFWGIPLGMAVSLGIALLLNMKVRGMSWYRTAYYMPSITPAVAAALLWPWLLNPELGLVNVLWKGTFTAWFGLAPPPWLAGELWSKPSYILMGLWGAGGAMILWLAGLQGIPGHLYEAAEIDGAGFWARFRNVTVPMLTPYIFFNLIMGTIASLQRFTDVYIMSGPQGGPVDSTMVPVLYLFNNAFQYFKMGYASAWAWILFVVILILTVIQLKLAPLWVYYESERK